VAKAYFDKYPNSFSKNEKAVPMLMGDIAFRIYETYGLPDDFIRETCKDEGIAFDEEGFNAAKEVEQERARASWKGGSQKSASPAYRDLAKTLFEGYTQLVSRDCEVLALV